MSKIVVFGTSHSVGHGLRDWSEQDMHRPSNYAWPSIVAANLGMPVENRSRCGSPIDEIYHNVLNYCITKTKDQKDDIVIVQVSSITHRFVLLQETEGLTKVKRFNIHSPDALEYQGGKAHNGLQLFYGKLTSDEHWTRTWLGYMAAILYVLKSHKCKFCWFEDAKTSLFSNKWDDISAVQMPILMKRVEEDSNYVGEAFSSWLRTVAGETFTDTGHHNEAGHAKWAMEVMVPYLKEHYDL
jgi:hypothetical protein